MVLGDVFPDVSNPKMIIYEFRTCHVNFTQNEHIILDETCLYIQGHFKTNLSNVLGRLTFKLHET